MTTIIVHFGFCAGRKPTNEAQTFSVYLPLTGICEVPVLPAWSSSKPCTRDDQPDPFCTTASIIAVIFLAVAALITWRWGCSITGLIVLPIRSTTCGCAYLPPLAIT